MSGGGGESGILTADPAWWAEFIQRTDYLRELADRLERELASFEAAAPHVDHAADLAAMRAQVAEADAQISAWRAHCLTLEIDA